MSTNWKNSVSAQGVNVSTINFSQGLKQSSITSLSAIDKFYERADVMKSLATNSSIFQNNQFTGQMILINMVSSTETYFREVLSAILKVCEISRKKSAEKNVELGSMMWHGVASLERIAFEYQSFSSKDAIERAIKGFLDEEIPKTSSFFNSLDTFDRLCEIRHCCVHSAGLVVGKNGTKLGLTPQKYEQCYEINQADIFHYMPICYTLVREANEFLYELMVTRWRRRWFYQSSKEKNAIKTYRKIHKIFYSVTDSSNSGIGNILTERQILSRILKEMP